MNHDGSGLHQHKLFGGTQRAGEPGAVAAVGSLLDELVHVIDSRKLAPDGGHTGGEGMGVDEHAGGTKRRIAAIFIELRAPLADLIPALDQRVTGKKRPAEHVGATIGGGLRVKQIGDLPRVATSMDDIEFVRTA
jgi:hypothetical protein